jgi:SAM-dependent methyltransferase
MIKTIKLILTGKTHRGYCTICQRKVLFIKEGIWLRDKYFCSRCHSIPRQRALIYFLEKLIPNWRNLKIKEFSPHGPTSDKFTKECNDYTRSHFSADISSGTIKNGRRYENLEKTSFPDNSFDIVITQDVFEHVLCPDKAFKEVARILKPNGVHIFSIPYYFWKDTLIRAIKKNGKITPLIKPEYHGDPAIGEGTIVAREWGRDLVSFIYKNSGMITEIYNTQNSNLGLKAKFLDIFVSRKIN